MTARSSPTPPDPASMSDIDSASRRSVIASANTIASARSCPASIPGLTRYRSSTPTAVPSARSGSANTAAASACIAAPANAGHRRCQCASRKSSASTGRPVTVASRHGPSPSSSCSCSTWSLTASLAQRCCWAAVAAIIVTPAPAMPGRCATHARHNGSTSGPCTATSRSIRRGPRPLTTAVAAGPSMPAHRSPTIEGPPSCPGAIDRIQIRHHNRRHQTDRHRPVAQQICLHPTPSARPADSPVTREHRPCPSRAMRPMVPPSLRLGARCRAGPQHPLLQQAVGGKGGRIAVGVGAARRPRRA